MSAPVAGGSQDAVFGGKVLTFSVSGTVFGIGIRDVKEIIEFGGVTRVPLVGRHICGVLNLRGRIVPVIDLAERLQLPGSGVGGRRACVIVMNTPTSDEIMELGIAVDAVNQVIPVSGADMQDAPGFGTRIREDFIVSMARVADQFVIILDQAKVLCMEELAETAA